MNNPDVTEEPKTPATSARRSGSASRAMQEIQTGILLFIWSNVTNNGLLMLGTAILGLCYIIGGVIRTMRE